MTVTPLDEIQQETLRCIAGHMIPASAQHNVPGADDPMIFADIVRSIDRDRAGVIRALCAIQEVAGGSIVTLPKAEQVAQLAGFRAADPALAGVLESVTLRCYYRDGRVMALIGMEVRPPFRGGYAVKRGDGALLEPVRARGKIYRNVE